MDMIRALAFSRYATRVLAADRELVQFLSEACARPFAWDDALAGIDADNGPEALAITLRRLRLRVFLHTLARDLMGLAPLTEVCGAMTQLAEVAVRPGSVRQVDPVQVGDGFRPS